MENKKCISNIKPMMCLDYTVLFLCAIMFFLSVIDKDKYYELISLDVEMAQQVITDTLLIIGIFKSFFYFDKNTKKAIIAILTLLFFSILKAIGYCDYIYLVTILVACFNTSFFSIAEVYAAVISVNLAFRFIFSKLGIIINNTTYSSNRLISNMESLGFRSHNTFMGIWFFLVMAIVSVVYYKKKKRITAIIILFLMTIYFYSITGSNTATVLSIIFLTTICIYGERSFIKSSMFYKKTNDIFIFLLAYTPLWSILILIFGLFIYGRFGYIDEIWTLMDRYGLFYRALLKLGLPVPFASRNIEPGYDINYSVLFGMRKGKFDGVEYFDIEYANILIQNGVVVLTVYIILQLLLLYRLRKNSQLFLMICYSFTIIYGCFEATVTNYLYGALFLFLAFSDYTDQKSDLIERQRNVFYK